LSGQLRTCTAAANRLPCFIFRILRRPLLATLFALAATSVALGIAATLTGLPLILFGLIIWFVVRSARRGGSSLDGSAPAH